MPDWTRKSLKREVDYSDEPLPPVWIPTGSYKLIQEEAAGNGVYRSGSKREAARAMLAALDQAQETVILTSYLLADAGIEEGLLRAAGRGVRVYLMFRSRLDEDPEQDFDQKVIAQHREMLRRLAGRVLIRCADFHAKALVIDPNGAAKGFLLTANVTVAALERNQELVVELSPAETRAVFDVLRWGFWESAETEVLEAGTDRNAEPLQLVAEPSSLEAGIVCTAGQTTSLRKAVEQLVHGSRRELVVASFGWEDQHEVVQMIAAKAREGTDVTLLARPRVASMPALLRLREANARVLGYKWLHVKAIWSDAGEALVMSSNLEAQGLDGGFELGVTLSGPRAGAVEGMLRSWVSAAPTSLELCPRVGHAVGTVQVWRDGRMLQVEIEREAKLDLGEVTADSADKLDEASPKFPKDASGTSLAHRVVFSWTAVAPSLADGAKEVPGNSVGKERAAPPHSSAGKKGKPSRTVQGPKVFREPSGELVVAVGGPDELEAARAIADEVGARAIVTGNRQ